ncbi:hypothetical protein D9756_010065 [Leucocoprinus leucothites]|uniref:Uncharacterized protein n=1 Tax=Leucocoprinus leucothites TaxID=201217 RepID=A0A8H5CRF0_9AGAR|nr:hypothetical protein D9756_010065 [Leucoagaricus leucothites]
MSELEESPVLPVPAQSTPRPESDARHLRAIGRGAVVVEGFATGDDSHGTISTIPPEVIEGNCILILDTVIDNVENQGQSSPHFPRAVRAPSDVGWQSTTQHPQEDHQEFELLRDPRHTSASTGIRGEARHSPVRPSTERQSRNTWPAPENSLPSGVPSHATPDPMPFDPNYMSVNFMLEETHVGLLHLMLSMRHEELNALPPELKTPAWKIRILHEMETEYWVSAALHD